MLVALALYASTAHAGIPAGFGGTPGVSRMRTSLTEDQRPLPKYSQGLWEAIRECLPVRVKPATPPQALLYCSPRTRLSVLPARGHGVWRTKRMRCGLPSSAFCPVG
jgi:hypothetical protein